MDKMSLNNRLIRIKANSYFHAARSTQTAARSTDHFNFNSYFHLQNYRSCVHMIKYTVYIVFNGKVEICSTLDFHP